MFSRLENMQGLTDRQSQVLEYIRSSIAHRGYPPTLREIGAHMGIRSTNGVNDHLRALERNGYLTREAIKSRALLQCDTDSLPSSVPANDEEGLVDIQVLGRVAAGLRILTKENVLDAV